MINLRMEEKIKKREALDLSKCPRIGESYVMTNLFGEVHVKFIDGMDYCDAQTEQWIWSIGHSLHSPLILASTSGIFYENHNYHCLFLR